MPVRLRELVWERQGIMDESWATDRTSEVASAYLRISGSSSNPLIESINLALTHIAKSDVPVLLCGESGVGKEVFARSIHSQSPRAAKPFLKINCAALPSELLESELFGYERGAFTGALKRMPGKFEAANGGIILLDEIGDMDVRLQAKLLHVLQDGEFQRVGGTDTVRVDVRVLAATHRDINRAIAEGRFREDLYYRLKVISIRIPPLRERRDEILPLSHFFLKKHAAEDAPVPALTPVLQEALLRYSWPGNIRELENVMRRYLVLRDPDTLASELQGGASSREARHAAKPSAKEVSPLAALDRARSAEMARTILEALEATRWNRRRAAALLQVDYNALLYRMKKLGITANTIAPAAGKHRAAGGDSTS